MHRIRSGGIRPAANAAAALSLSAALLAACSSGDAGGNDAAAPQPSTSTMSGPPSATPTPTPTPTPAVDLAALSADEILARAKEAGKRAGSTQVLGDVSQGDQRVRLDLQVQQENGKGTIEAQGVAFDVVKVGDALFLQGDEKFYSRFGGGEAAKLLKGKWLKGSPQDQQLGQLGGFFSIDQLLDQILSPTAKLEKGEETTVDGQRALTLKTVDGKGELAVALEGEPYPLQLVPGENNAADDGKLTFTRWGETFDITAPDPSDVVDPAKLRAPSPAPTSTG